MAELPHIGEHCGVEICHQLDFLPVKCDACSGTFCVDHFTYDSHSCCNAYKKNVQVPVCPLCSQPVPTPRGVSPDYHVNDHIQNNCAVTKKAKIFKNMCTVRGCKKKELIPVTCSACKQNFCLGHRHEKDHQCEGKAVLGVSKAGSAALSRLQGVKNCSTQARSSQMTPDEELARVLAASLNDTHLSPEERDRQMAEQLQREEYQTQGRGRPQSNQSMSEKCSVS